MYAQDIAPATVDEVIEKIARKVVEAKEAPAILALDSMSARWTRSPISQNKERKEKTWNLFQVGC
jgi:KaiC/GvpD/RAD55 family RecA-like ATPase